MPRLNPVFLQILANMAQLASAEKIGLYTLVQTPVRIIYALNRIG